MTSGGARVARMCYLLNRGQQRTFLSHTHQQQVLLATVNESRHCFIRYSSTNAIDINNDASKDQTDAKGTSDESICGNNDPSLPTSEQSATVMSSEDLDKLLKSAMVEVQELSDLAVQSSSSSKRFPEPVVMPSSTSERRSTSHISHRSGTTTNTRSTSTISPSFRKQSHDSSPQTLNRNGIDQVQHEVEAAEALLRLTSHPSFGYALEEQRKKNPIKSTRKQQDPDVLSSLHMAFISVASWLISSSQVKTSTSTAKRSMTENLISVILKLHQRSMNLQLPLTIHLYESISVLIAKYDNRLGVGMKILDFASEVQELLNNASSDDEQEDRVVDSLLSTPEDTNTPLRRRRDYTGVGPIDDLDVVGINDNGCLPVSFFSNTLKELIHQNKFRDAIEVIEGMKASDGIGNLDLGLNLELLSAVKDKVGESMTQEDARIWNELGENYDDRDDAGNDDSICSDSSNHVFCESQNELVDESDVVELVFLLQEPIMDALDTMRRNDLNQITPLLPESDAIPFTARIDVDPLSEAIEVSGQMILDKEQSFTPLPTKDMDDYHDLMTKECIYIRDSSYELPDIVPQLEEWNGNHELLFTKEYEERLLRNIFSESDDDDTM